jgi:hypothetical protein
LVSAPRIRTSHLVFEFEELFVMRLIRYASLSFYCGTVFFYRRNLFTTTPKEQGQADTKENEGLFYLIRNNNRSFSSVHLTKKCHCEPFFGEAIPCSAAFPLSKGDCRAAKEKKRRLAMTHVR